MLRTAARHPSKTWWAQPTRIGEGRYLVFLLLMADFWTSFNQIFMTLPEYIRGHVDTSDLIAALTAAAAIVGADLDNWSRELLENGQLKPEHLINLNAFGIICCQVVIPKIVHRRSPLTSIILGVTVASFLIHLVGGSGWVVFAAILVFSIGEMLASPCSKEYAGRIALPGKVGA